MLKETFFFPFFFTVLMFMWTSHSQFQLVANILHQWIGFSPPMSVSLEYPSSITASQMEPFLQTWVFQTRFNSLSVSFQTFVLGEGLLLFFLVFDQACFNMETNYSLLLEGTRHSAPHLRTEMISIWLDLVIPFDFLLLNILQRFAVYCCRGTVDLRCHRHAQCETQTHLMLALELIVAALP